MGDVDNRSKLVLLIDGYEVYVELGDFVQFDEAIKFGDEVEIGAIEYRFEVLYDFDDQEEYDAVHRMIAPKIPEKINERIEQAIIAKAEHTQTETKESET